MKRITILILLLISLVIVATPVHAQTTPHFEKVTGGFQAPVAVVGAPGDSARLYVVELKGKIRVVENGVLQATPFLDLSALVMTEIFGQGLFDIAFHPDYAHNSYFFVNYIDQTGTPVLARYTASNPDQADPNSAKVILKIAHPHSFHYGGQIAFGPDGYLYYSMGDSGSALDKEGSAQDKTSLLGALLRLDVDHEDRGNAYAIPADNPYANDPQARPELWAKGLRNPWRFSFDSTTGDLYIADVGEDVYEEIDFQPAGDKGGANYGWNLYEGTHDIKGGSKTGLTFPILEYAHVDSNCAVIGGTVYRGKLIPTLVGQYVFADYCSGQVWTATSDKKSWVMSPFLHTSYAITGFGEDSAHELYMVEMKTNALYKLLP
jgi:glucose/arabinose dehydrogenase